MEEVSKEALSNWKHHPVTRSFFGYLSDLSTQIAEDIAAAVKSGEAIPEDVIKEAALRCEIMGDIQRIDHSDFARFYDYDKSEEQAFDVVA